MAHIVGTSGALKAVRQRASVLGISIDGDSLGPLGYAISQLEEEQAQQPDLATAQVDAHIQAASNTVESLNRRSERRIQAVDRLDRALRLTLDRDTCDLRQPPHRFLKELVIVWKRLGVAHRHRCLRRIGRSVARNLAQQERWLDKLRGSRETLIARKITSIEERLSAAKHLLGSTDVAGARGELAVVNALRPLPNSFWLLHDVQLKANSFIRFDGVPLQSAQVDHIVVGLSGVFVIETKYWSALTASKGQVFDPFQQVKRAGYLCYRLLKDAGLKCPVRTVIASGGSLPPRPPDSKVKVLPPPDLPGYIRWFGGELSESSVEEVAQFLMDRIAQF